MRLREAAGWLLILGIMLTGGCSAIQRGTEALKGLQVRYDRLEDRYDKVVGLVSKATEFGKDALAKAKDADTNADGKLSFAEMLTWGIGLLGGGGTAAGVVINRAAKRNGASDERKARMEGRQDATDAKLEQLRGMFSGFLDKAAVASDMHAAGGK